MERHHALSHVRDLRARIGFLRPMRPANPTYLLWIGDIAELANSVWGPGSAQTARLADALRGGGPKGGADAGDSAYLDRLRALDAVLAEFEAELEVVS